jgi:hypothetical protein
MVAVVPGVFVPGVVAPGILALEVVDPGVVDPCVVPDLVQKQDRGRLSVVPSCHSRGFFPPVQGGVIGMNYIKTDYIVFILRIAWTP